MVLMEPRYPIPTVGALLRGPSGRVLIVKTTKWRGLWGVPGGKINWGEPLEAALKREFCEEVGLELTNIRYAMLLEGVFDPQFHKPMHFLFINYFAESQGETITPNEEIAEWAWVTPEEALSYPLNNITRTLIEAYLTNMQSQANTFAPTNQSIAFPDLDSGSTLGSLNQASIAAPLIETSIPVALNQTRMPVPLNQTSISTPIDETQLLPSLNKGGRGDS